MSAVCMPFRRSYRPVCAILLLHLLEGTGALQLGGAFCATLSVNDYGPPAADC